MILIIKSILNRYSLSIKMSIFALWIFSLWRLTGMPSPGFAGRFIPLAWIFAAILNWKTQFSYSQVNKFDKWFLPNVLSFTITAWLWQLHPNIWLLASAIPIGGLIVWAISSADRIGTIRAVLPILFLSLLAAEVNSDEVRFAEMSVSITGTSSDLYGNSVMRDGDIDEEVGHHTPLFPLLISPGLFLGDWGIRIIPALIALLGVYLIGKLSSPQIAVISALLYPGFSIFGLAMTGWLVVVLFLIVLLLPKEYRWLPLKFFIVLLMVALKMRYLGMALGIVIAEYISLPKRRGHFKIPFLIGSVTLVILIIDRYLLNGTIFWARYGNIDALQLVWANIFIRPLETIANVGYSLFDPEAGLLFRAPWVIAALPGLSKLKVESPALFKKLLIPSVCYFFVVVLWSGSAWHGLPAPAGRIFVPLLPLFAAGLAHSWSRSGTRILVIISIFVSAIVLAFPEARYNQADGSDSLLNFFEVSGLFSMVRSSSLLLIIPSLLLLFSIMVFKKYNKQAQSGALLVIIFVAFVLVSLHNDVIQVEDMSAEMVQGVMFYPENVDATQRYYWPGSRERLLFISELGQSILLPGVSSGDTLLMWLSGNSGTLQIGEQHLFIQTPLMHLPAAYASVRQNARILPDFPENREIEVFRANLTDDDILENRVRITHFSGAPVYFDKLQVRKWIENE